ncbi:MAG: PRK06851 family protein [Turicibacter sp.]|nr:PRK06851 family protein [Turicibacter sp.]
MSAKIKKYFACANSSRGFYNFFESNLQGLEQLYILKGGPGTGKSTLMKKVGKHFHELGYDIELIYCSSDPDSLDGVLIPALKVGIVDGTAPHVIEPTAPGAIEQYVNLGIAWNKEKLQPFKDEILTLKREIGACYDLLYFEYANALKIHDAWEKIYIDEMDFDLAPQFRHAICESLLNYKAVDHTAVVKHRFFGASTPTGSVDHIENLTQGLKRYFIKGRPGTSKSTLLKELAKKSEALGYDTEVYHCSFDPESLDMVLVPDLNICFFDSTAPHEYFPSLETDEVIDTYAALITPGTDEENAAQLAEIADAYHTTVKLGTKALGEAKRLHDVLEKIYINATNFEIVEAFYQQIKSEIEDLME